VPIENSGRLSTQLISGASLIEYAGTPHALVFTEKDRLNADLLAFIEG
jgi:non-heme chloroperoxidase